MTPGRLGRASRALTPSYLLQTRVTCSKVKKYGRRSLNHCRAPDTSPRSTLRPQRDQRHRSAPGSRPVRTRSELSPRPIRPRRPILSAPAFCQKLTPCRVSAAQWGGEASCESLRDLGGGEPASPHCPRHCPNAKQPRAQTCGRPCRRQTQVYAVSRRRTHRSLRELAVDLPPKNTRFPSGIRVRCDFGSSLFMFCPS